jgi:site-specific DNA recombinase
VPQEVVSQIVTTVRKDQQQSASRVSAERSRLDVRLTAIRKRMDGAYADKLDGKISEDFWERRASDWRMEELQVKMAIQGLSEAETGDRALDAQRIFELANKAYLLYVSQASTEKAKLLKMLLGAEGFEPPTLCSQRMAT